MAIAAPFKNREEAWVAYYGDDGSGGDNGGGDTSSGDWNDLQRQTTLSPDWTLASQTHQTDDKERWFVFRLTDNDEIEAITAQGTATKPGPKASLSEWPQYPTEEEARTAYEKWADQNDVSTSDESENWGEWRKVRQAEPWWIFTRVHKSEDKVQFVVSGKIGDGSTVYLGPRGEVHDEAHIFDSVDSLRSALGAYFQAVEDGEIPDERQPNGEAPTTKEISESVRTSATKSTSKVMEKLGGKKVLLGAVAVAGLVALRGANGGGGN